MEGIPDVHHPNRDQTAEFYGNQTELNASSRPEPSSTTWSPAWSSAARRSIDRTSPSRTATTTSLRRSPCCPPGDSRPRPFPPNPYSPIDKITGRPWVYDATIDTAGLYLLDTVHLSDQWIVNGGIRYDDFERDQVGLAAANTANVQADLFSWNVGVVYKPIPISSFYAAYGTSESPIGSELDSTGPSTTD